ncbi:MAG: damage-inducible protein DinB [Acidobacteria bacterium]|nr:MAG: damage-inducible protein DinB [Acidobacteriota bacterium]
MITPEHARALFAYDAWANRRILDATAALSPEQFTRDLGSSFRSVRDTLAHILGAEWVWLERFHGRMPASLPSADQFPDLASLRGRWTQFESDLLSYVGGLSAADLERSFDYRDTKGNPHSFVLWQALQHLANHGTYHRGQVITLLRQLGAKPVSTDLIGFFRERAAQAAH